MRELAGTFVKLNVVSKKVTPLYPMHSIISIDFFARRILGEGGNGIGIYDLDTGTFLEKVNINAYHASNCILIGNQIFSDQGYVYELNQ